MGDTSLGSYFAVEPPLLLTMLKLVVLKVQMTSFTNLNSVQKN